MSEPMLCEPKDGGWHCHIRRDRKWVEVGNFDAIIIDNQRVTLPIIAKVMFDGKNCEMEKEGNLKILHCKGEIKN